MVDMIPISSSDGDRFMEMAAHYFSELNPGFIPHDDWKRDYLSSILSNQHCFLKWIVSDGNKAGFMLYGLESHRFLPRTTGVIYEIHVLPEFRRRGIARMCALEAIQQLQEMKPSKIQIEIAEGNTAAVAFWNSLGFRKVAERFVRDGSAA